MNCPVPPSHEIGVIATSVRTIGSNTSNKYPPFTFSTKILPQPEESVTTALYWPMLSPVNISKPAVPGTSFQTVSGVVESDDKFVVKPYAGAIDWAWKLLIISELTIIEEPLK